MITIDAHSRDMVANILEAGATNQDCFLWLCQLRRCACVCGGGEGAAA